MKHLIQYTKDRLSDKFQKRRSKNKDIDLNKIREKLLWNPKPSNLVLTRRQTIPFYNVLQHFANRFSHTLHPHISCIAQYWRVNALLKQSPATF